MIKGHLQGVVNAIVQGVSNARAESSNALIQDIKRRACSIRKRERFRNAICFHLSGPDHIRRRSEVIVAEAPLTRF